jgi:hypothetical protein
MKRGCCCSIRGCVLADWRFYLLTEGGDGLLTTPDGKPLSARFLSPDAARFIARLKQKAA